MSHHKSERLRVVHDGERVIDCCKGARGRAVKPGTQLSEAKAILRDDAEYAQFLEENYLAMRNYWLNLCLAYSSQIEPESPASAWIDLSSHPDPYDIACCLVRNLAAQGLQVYSALSSSKWVSKLAARYCNKAVTKLGIPDLPYIKHLPDFIAPLPTSLASPLDPDHRKRLEFLGYRFLGDMRDAPLSALLKQFGKDALLIKELVHGRYKDKVKPNYPELTLEHSTNFESPIQDRFVLEDAAILVASKLSESLQAQDKEAGKVDLYVQLEDDTVDHIGRSIPKPTASLSYSINYLFSQMLIEQPVVSIRAAVSDLKDTPAVQKSLATSKQKDNQVATRAALSTLHCAFGTSSVVRASEIRKPRRELVLKAWNNATGWR